MRKLFVLLVLMGTLSMMLMGCGGASSSKDVTDLLEDNGYVLEARDEDSINYYEATMINDKYDLNVEVTSLYVGYVNSDERWAEIVVLKTEAQAEDFVQALVNENVQGRYNIRQENVVIITFSQETNALFSSKVS